MLVVANISAEIAHWSVRGTNGFDLLGCDDVHVTLWTIWVICWFFIKFFLNSFGLGHVDITFRSCLNNLIAHVRNVSQLNLGGMQIGLNVKVDDAPVFQKGMKSNDTANVAWKLLSAFGSGKVCFGVFSVWLYDIISIIQICLRIFMTEFLTEELRKSLHLDFMNRVQVEPLCATRNNKWLLLKWSFNISISLNLLQMLFFFLVFNSVFAFDLFIHFLWFCSFLAQICRQSFGCIHWSDDQRICAVFFFLWLVLLHLVLQIAQGFFSLLSLSLFVVCLLLCGSWCLSGFLGPSVLSIWQSLKGDGEFFLFLFDVLTAHLWFVI